MADTWTCPLCGVVYSNLGDHAPFVHPHDFAPGTKALAAVERISEAARVGAAVLAFSRHLGLFQSFEVIKKHDGLHVFWAHPRPDVPRESVWVGHTEDAAEMAEALEALAARVAAEESE